MIFSLFTELELSDVPPKVYIFFEKVLIMEYNACSMIDTLIYIICLFYTFNLMYPKETLQTMEFFIRYFLRYYPEKVRGSKKNSNNINKINNLMKKLRDFQM